MQKIKNYYELRKFLIQSNKYPNCKFKSRAPLMHKGFPGTFNLSFTEYDVLNEFGNFSSFNHDLIFSAIQSCIRPQDILKNIKNNNGPWKYLSTFEMSDIAGQIILEEEGKTKEIHLFQLKQLIKILEKLGLDKNKIFPSYCKGGNLSEITNDKYNFNFKVPEDTFTKQAFIKAGIPKENLIPDKSRNTFLSLHVNMKTPWGFRNEINYNIGTKEKPLFLDIATLEYLIWEPIYSGKEISKNITGLKKINHSISVGGIGVERLYMTIKKIKKIQEIDYLHDFYKLLKELNPKLKNNNIIKTGECLRTIHRIFSDIKKFNINKIGKNRNYNIKRFISIICENIPEFKENNFKELLELHSISQPWHKELKEGIDPTIKRINQYYNNPQRIREIKKKKKSISMKNTQPHNTPHF